MRQSLKLSEGDFSIFFSRPISLTLLALAMLVVLSNFFFKSQHEVLDEKAEKV